MRLSLVSTALFGAVTILAATLPRKPNNAKRQDPVDLDQFGAGFNMLSLEEIAAAAKDIFDPSKVTAPEDIESSGSSDVADGEDAKVGNGVTVAAGTCTAPSVRVEWRDMADSDKTAFVDAISCLLEAPSAGDYPGATNRYEDLVVVHQQLTGSIHMVGQFLPWHRYFLSIYESLLRDECGYAGAMPWWDETKDAGNFANSPVFTDQWFGLLPAKTADGQGTCITSGAFSGLQLHIGPGSDNSEHCLSRALDESLTAQCNQDFVDQCNSYANYTDMEGCTEDGPHAYGHNGIGAVMSEVSASPGDPAFFMHHSFVDHSWHIWQSADTTNRLYQIGGNSTTTVPTQILTLDYVLTSQGLKPNITVKDVMDTEGEYLCYNYSY